MAPGGRVPDLEGRVAMAPCICAISQRVSRRGGTVVTATRYRRMEVMGCPPLSLPTLDPRSYRIDPPQGKKARAEEFAKTAHVGSRWEELLVNRLKPAAPVASDWESPYRWPGTDDE